MVARKQALDPALAAILASVNVDLEEEIEYDDTPEQIKFKGEAILYHLEYPLSPRVTKVCKWNECGQVFLTDYYPTGYCSNECRVKDLKEHFGIAWRPDNRASRERFESFLPPGIIPESALRAMKAIILQAELDLGRPIEIGVELKPYSVKLPFVPQKQASEPNYKLPDLVESSSASYKELPSVPQAQENQPDKPLSDKTEKSVQSQEQEKSLGLSSLVEDPFADLW
jgi:hypothetical protein